VDFRILIFIAAVVLPSAAVADDAADRLRALIGDGTYQAAGLDALSEQQRVVLEAWLNGRLQQRAVPMPGTTVSYSTPGTGGGSTAAVDDPRLTTEVGEDGRTHVRMAFGLDDSGQDSMESFIDGAFEGWDGTTTFRLQNGTIWEQVNPNDELVVPRAVTNPAVSIERGYFGYRFRVEGFNKRTQVRRVE
jgi:type II secretory pathway pseudopilin PulG